MTIVWLCCSFNFYLIQFLFTSFEQVYTTAIVSCVSDVVAYASGGLFVNCLGIKKTQILGCSIALLGGVTILAFGLKHQDSWSFLVLVMLAKFGVALSFGINYLSNPYLFPTLFAATALGFCNTFARLFSALSPMFAQMDEPIPMILFVACSTLTLVAVFAL